MGYIVQRGLHAVYEGLDSFEHPVKEYDQLLEFIPREVFRDSVVHLARIDNEADHVDQAANGS